VKESEELDDFEYISEGEEQRREEEERKAMEND